MLSRRRRRRLRTQGADARRGPHHAVLSPWSRGPGPPGPSGSTSAYGPVRFLRLQQRRSPATAELVAVRRIRIGLKLGGRRFSAPTSSSRGVTTQLLVGSARPGTSSSSSTSASSKEQWRQRQQEAAPSIRPTRPSGPTKPASVLRAPLAGPGAGARPLRSRGTRLAPEVGGGGRGSGAPG